MPTRLTWEHQIEMPFSDRVHDAIYGYLRTSRFGEWKPDESESGDHYVLHFRRGSWMRSLFGIGKKLVPDWRPGMAAERAPMTLRVTLRPAPALLVIGLFHSCHRAIDLTSTEAERCFEFLSPHVRSEVDSLATYLRDCLQLDYAPKVIGPTTPRRTLS